MIICRPAPSRMTDRGPVETELKFDLDVAAAKRLRTELLLADAAGEEHALRSVYFDTPAFDLRAGGFALRIREDAGKRVQTVKQSAGDGAFTRGEWECDVDGLQPDLAAIARTPLGAVLKRAGREALRPMFEVRVDRARRDVGVGGAVVEVALDRGLVAANGSDTPICELELELKSGETGSLFALARTLSEAAKLDLAFTSKAERGYALLEGEPRGALKAAAPALRRGDDAGQAFRAIAGACLSQIAGNARILRSARRPEALHQLRVGLRRLRSALSLFKPMLADDAFEAIKSELKWMTQQLNDARNLDVFIAQTFRRAAKQGADAPGLGAFGEALLAAQTRAYDQAETAVRSPRFRGMMLETAAWIEAGKWTAMDEPSAAALRARPIKALASEILTRRRAKIDKKARRLEELEPAIRHKLRIQAKTMRYACEFFSALYAGKSGAAYAGFVAAMAEMQDTLGALNDIVVGRDLAARVAGALGETSGSAGDPRPAFAAGLLAGQRAATEAELIKAAAKTCRRFKKADRFW
jgi:triphosphatase